jgi:1-acyl-sn-glycerol-3-phosphate acyltransferase
MVAREYMEHPLLAWMFTVVPCIPVGRGGIDTAATRLAIRMLNEGALVGMFPEGKINETDALLLPGRLGAAMIALRAKVPVVPCFISGAPYRGTTISPLFMPSRVRIAVGPPLDFSEFYGREGERSVQEMLTRRILAELARLAGAEGFEPEVAGRRERAEGGGQESGDRGQESGVRDQESGVRGQESANGGHKSENGRQGCGARSQLAETIDEAPRHVS